MMATDAAPKLPGRVAVVEDGDGPLMTRTHEEAAHPYRTPFSRDCGRLLHARAFRRLAGKTQVFTRQATDQDPVSDHVRSRLTHTLEVAQIARIVAGTLGLNAQLAETLALAHDIGHPPFGHAGEKALDAALKEHGLGFDHNLHALRIVTDFEQRYAGFRGLNLTLGVREGIVKHSRDYRAAEHPELGEYLLDSFPPLEAQLIDLADEIAYLTADMEDGLGAGILSVDTLQAEVPLFGEFYRRARALWTAAEMRLVANEALKMMLNALVTDLMTETAQQAEAAGVTTLAEVRQAPRRLATLGMPMEEKRRVAKAHLFAELYESPRMMAEHDHAEEVIRELFAAWVQEPERMPADHLGRAREVGAPRAVADYLAGMTDGYIEQAWERFRAEKMR